VTAADRLGRRRLLLWSIGMSSALTALGAFAPSLSSLAALQLFARGGTSAAIVLIGVITAEEMPAGSRAYAVSILTMAGAFGAGLGAMSLPITAVGVRAWRLLFAAGSIGLVVLTPVARRLPESRRFVAVHARATMRGHVGRLVLLAASSLLFQAWATPASQFTNEFLRKERNFGAPAITAFTIGTYTPAGIGIAAGGRLADVHGRRVIGAVGLVLGTIGGVALFYANGWPMWAWALFGNMAAALTVPALAVYGPELFPTGLRGRANGIINVVGAAGGAFGLVAVGRLASRSHYGTLATPLAIFGIAPLLLAVLILARYPETAHRELEDLNPEDRVPYDRS
jgi:MFS family permease